MEKKKEYAVSYYGGHVSAWLCVVVAILGIMYLLLVRGGGTKSMMVALFFSLVLGLILAKDRKAYGEEMLTGLRESMFCVICVAFFMAGLLSSLLKTSGLIQALIWVVAELHVNTGFIPVVAFLICIVISTACGTSTGTVTAVSAVMCPLAGELGIDMGLMCGAIISGSIFGDNLAPISDTTIASSQTQGVTVQEAVRTRLPYSIIVDYFRYSLHCDWPVPVNRRKRGYCGRSLLCQVPGIPADPCGSCSADVQGLGAGFCAAAL